MDTLSSPISTFQIHNLYSTPREFCSFKIPNTSNLPPQPHKPSSISNKTTSFTHKNFPPPFSSSSSSQPSSLKSSPTIHRKPASGYAAALLDIALCNNSLESVEKDVRRLSETLRNKQFLAFMNDPYVGDKEKGIVVKEVAEKGRFQKQLVRLLKMLVDKNKMGMVSEVLDEFERIYDELSGTRVVLVSSAKKMEEDQLLGIAKKEQKLSGAIKVKIDEGEVPDEKEIETRDNTT